MRLIVRDTNLFIFFFDEMELCVLTKAPAGRALTSDWLIHPTGNGFIMVVSKIFFFKFSQNTLSKAGLKYFLRPPYRRQSIKHYQRVGKV